MVWGDGDCALRSVPRLGDKREKGIPKPAHRAGSDGGPARLRALSAAASRRPEAVRLRAASSPSSSSSPAAPLLTASRERGCGAGSRGPQGPGKSATVPLEGGPAPSRIASLDSNYSQLP